MICFLLRSEIDGSDRHTALTISKVEVKELRKFEKAETEKQKQCTKCLEPCKSCFEKDEKYKELKCHTDNLASDFKETKEAYDKLSKTINQYRREDNATLSMLKATVIDKQMAKNIHIDNIAKLKQELEAMRIETEQVDKKLTSYSTASYVLDHILPKQTYWKR